MAHVAITELSKATGFPSSALRYYERIGLLSPVGRSSGGYRLYDARAALADVRRAGGSMRSRLRMRRGTTGRLRCHGRAGTCRSDLVPTGCRRDRLHPRRKRRPATVDRVAVDTRPGRGTTLQFRRTLTAISPRSRTA